MISSIVALVVAILHVGFMVLESVLWTKPQGRKIFQLSAEDAETTKVLASNQGVYNGMVAVGIVWAMAMGNPGTLGFLLVFVVIVGIYGAVTVKPTIFLLQSLPALIALGLIQLGM